MEQFKTSNGKTLLDSQVQNLVSAMAAFAPPASGQTTSGGTRSMCLPLAGFSTGLPRAVQVAELQGLITRAQMEALLVPKNLTAPQRADRR